MGNIITEQKLYCPLVFKFDSRDGKSSYEVDPAIYTHYVRNINEAIRESLSDEDERKYGLNSYTGSEHLAKKAKLIGLEGNRRFGDRIVAGTFFICGDGGEDFCSLTDEQCEKYVREFAEPHEITQDEVEQDMGCIIIGF